MPKFNQFIAKGKKIRLPNKKKDVGSIKSSLVPTIQFINPLPIDSQNPNPINPVTRAGTGEVIIIHLENPNSIPIPIVDKFQ